MQQRVPAKCDGIASEDKEITKHLQTGQNIYVEHITLAAMTKSHRYK